MSETVLLRHPARPPHPAVGVHRGLKRGGTPLRPAGRVGLLSASRSKRCSGTWDPSRIVAAGSVAPDRSKSTPKKE
jgi:hypothetical protein